MLSNELFCHIKYNIKYIPDTIGSCVKATTLKLNNYRPVSLKCAQMPLSRVKLNVVRPWKFKLAIVPCFHEDLGCFSDPLPTRYRTYFDISCVVYVNTGDISRNKDKQLSIINWQNGHVIGFTDRSNYQCHSRSSLDLGSFQWHW